MSDLSIPGVTNNLNTQKIIDTLMKAERIPLERVQAEQALEKQQKAAWQDITRKVTGLREAARSLFGASNPFAEKLAESSDSSILTAIAKRGTMNEQKEIVVKRLATADRFLSQSLPSTFKVEAGNYTITVGDKEVSFSFKGGSLQDFADTLNKRGGDLVSASVVADTRTTRVLLIESKKTGAKNPLSFSGASEALAVQAGIMERVVSTARELSLTQKSLQAWVKPLTPDAYTLKDGELTLNPGAELKIPVQPSLALNPNMVLELKVKTENIPLPGTQAQVPANGPAIPETGSITFEGITIHSGRSQAPVPELTPQKPPENITDMQVLFMEGAGKLTPLPQLTESADYQTVQIPIGELSASIDSLDLRNRNTYRKIDIKDVRIFDKAERGGLTPKNALSKAGDALISMDGIDVTRDTNVIDDLLPGVTLTLKGQSDKPVDLTVKPNVQAIQDVVVGFIGTYDRVITDIDILTRKDDKVITDATFLTEDEKKTAEKNMGLFMGDLSLSQLKDSMQRVMMNPYPTSKGKELTLLAQIGIATDTRTLGSGIDMSRLRGFLEVDTAKLDQAIAVSPEAVQQLFGNDTTGDLIVDSGVAYSIDALLRPYVMIGGLFPSKITNLDSQMSRTNREIATLEEKLKDKEAELKQKYAIMEGAVNQLQKNSQDIQNFNKQNQ